MKKRILAWAACATALSLALAVGCSKKSPQAPEAQAPVAAPAPAPIPTAPPATAPEATKTEAALSTAGAGGLTPQQISDAVSKAICKRMTTCNPQGGSESDCASGLSKDMAANLSDKARAIVQTTLDTCLASVTKATCEQLAAPTPPAGCEFMD